MLYFCVPLSGPERQRDLRDWLQHECRGRIGWGTCRYRNYAVSDREIAIRSLSGDITYMAGLDNRYLVAFEEEIDAVSMMLHFPEVIRTNSHFDLNRPL